MKRSYFLKQSGLLLAGAALSRFPAIAGPFTAEDLTVTGAPLNKRLDPMWVKSLYERGGVTTYSKTKNELRYIGMPVGGICCGNVYLGGDGRLWLWDIYNQNQNGAFPKTLPVKLEGFNVNEINNTHGTLYLEPATEVRPFQQGFALIITHDGNKIVKRLHYDDWDEISFEATYPVATIRYMHKDIPLEIEMKAFSPFIPGDEYNSGLPATIQSIHIKNTSAKEVSVDMVGWLENKTLPVTGNDKKDFNRVNEVYKTALGSNISLARKTADAEILQSKDYGDMAFTTLSKNAVCLPALSKAENVEELKQFIKEEDGLPVAVLRNHFKIQPKQAINADYIISWFVPNLAFNEIPDKGKFYANHFKDALAVSTYIAGQFNRLKSKTLLWQKTWYDSTLPWWFLERTFLNTSILATTTSHRLKTGRFYSWEGVGCCAGTCTHVWQYAQAVGRIFPALEKDTRQRVDLGLSLHPDGGMSFRGEADRSPAIDGQAGTVLRFYREHQMSSTDGFLRGYWKLIKRTIQFIIDQDRNKDGMEDTPMMNTLDAVWDGEISWIVGLCIAAVRAGQAMAEEMNDTAFAEACKQYVEKGKKNMEDKLFNGEYFIHRPDPQKGKKEIGSYNTCHIDQVYGQSWAWQVGLGRVLDKEKTMSALQALWKYNYLPDVGNYIKEHPGGRFYALAGDGGMLMNTNPLNEAQPYGNAKAWQTGYFSECMSGFEHQVAAHMMAEGMTEEALVLTKSIHDRYHAYKRNPFNEIECSDHYARAMASYGTFISACGFTYHGPKARIGFAPKFSPENFKAPFTSAEGWGTYQQLKKEDKQVSTIEVKYGTLRLQTIDLIVEPGKKVSSVSVTLRGKKIAAGYNQQEDNITCTLKAPVVIKEGQSIIIGIQ